MGSRLVSLLLSLMFVSVVGCGGGGKTNTPAPTMTGNAFSTSFTPDHVFLIVLENHSFSQVIGSPAMLYLNSLAAQHGLSSGYFANSHPSIGNYFMVTAGAMETNNDAFTGIVSDNNIVRALNGAGKTWKAYMESIPAVGYTGGDVYPYSKHHNPFVFFSDVLSSSVQVMSIVPFTRLASDVSAGTLPQFAFIGPNLIHDAHDCPGGATATCPDSDKLATADNWLRANIDSLIQNPALANSVFIITFDESVDTDVTNGGGNVPFILAGSHVKAGFRSATMYQHQSLLRTVLDLLKVSNMPNGAATAPVMAEFFQ